MIPLRASASPAHLGRTPGAPRRPARYATHEPSPALRRALAAHKHGAFAEALSLYREALSHAPHSPDALDIWANLGACATRVGLASLSREALSRACALAPHDPRVLRDAARCLAVLGDLEPARERLSRAVELDPHAVGARLSLSRVCSDLGDHDAARAYAHEACTRAPDNASAWLCLHRALFDDRAPHAAWPALQRALALAPDDPHAQLYALGLCALSGEPLPAHAGVDPALRDALDFARAHRNAHTRFFAFKRDALRYALAMAEGRGPVLEFGVRHGASTRVLAQGCDALHAFDSFEGLPDAWGSVPKGAFTTALELPEVPSHVTFHVGRFEDTLPPFVAALREPPRLVHLDSDLYASARTVLTALGHALPSGCVLLFDEYLGNRSWRSDEHRAFHEACARFSWRWEPLGWSWYTGQGMVRVHPSL